MKRLFSVLALTMILTAVMLAAVPPGVPLNTQLIQGNVHLYVYQLTAQPVFAVPNAAPNQNWRNYFLFQVWDTADLPATAYKLTVTFTSNGYKCTSTAILNRSNLTPEAIAASVPVFVVLNLGDENAVINSVRVELLVPAASESFTE